MNRVGPFEEKAGCGHSTLRTEYRCGECWEQMRRVLDTLVHIIETDQVPVCEECQGENSCCAAVKLAKDVLANTSQPVTLRGARGGNEGGAS